MDSKRPGPRISANKLAEYMTCSPARRARILSDSKYPTDFIPNRYNDFYDIAAKYIVSCPLDNHIVTSAIDSLFARIPASGWESDNAQLNADALNQLLNLPNLIDLEGYERKIVDTQKQSLLMEGIEISIRPDVLLSRRVRGVAALGAVKFYLPKSYPLNNVSGAYLAILTKLYLEQEFSSLNVDYRHCFAYDIPSDRIYTSPRASARRRSDIGAACQEIYDRWAQI